MQFSNPSTTCIIIVNYKTPQLVIEGISELAKQKDELNGGKVIIVDNYSCDGSIEAIQSTITNNKWQSWVELLISNKNGGFAYGNNIGFKHALALQKPDYFILLNPDTLVRENAIHALIEFMNSHPKAGLAGSRLENKHGEIENSAHNFPNPISQLLDGARLNILTNLLKQYEVTPKRKNTQHICDWVSGSSMIMRTSLLDNVGFFDDTFFLYFEEVDFFQRAAKAGWDVWYEPNSLVMHIEGVSTGIKTNKRRPAYWFFSRRRYFTKHYGILGLFFANSLWSVGRLSFKLRSFFLLAKGDEIKIPYFTFDMLWGDLKAFMSGELFQIKKEINEKDSSR